MAEGLIDILEAAGATIGVPGCGPCSGCHQGMIAGGENAITTSSRNFKGRHGSPEGNIYVASPATVAASAIAGRIVMPGTNAEVLQCA
jgi:homoaconitase/3-isopropylmalate dehydratase large subunit